MKINPDEISLDTTTHSYTLYQFKDIEKHQEKPKDPRKYFNLAFFTTLGMVPLPPLYQSFSKRWLQQSFLRLTGKATSTEHNHDLQSYFDKIYDFQKEETIIGAKALQIDLFSAFPEYKESASMYQYNLAFKKKAYTFDAGKFSEKLATELEKRPNFSLRCNSEVCGLNYSKETGSVDSVKILGKVGKDVKCDAIVLCTGAATSRILYQTLGICSPLIPIKGITFDFATKVAN